MPLEPVRKKDVFCFGRKDVSDVRSERETVFAFSFLFWEKCGAAVHDCFGNKAASSSLSGGGTVFCNPDFVSEKGAGVSVIHQASF